MKIIAATWSCELVPAVEVVKLHQEPEPLWGVRALPGGLQMGTLEVRALCRRQGWQLIETGLREARQAVGDEWTPPRAGSTLGNLYCV